MSESTVPLSNSSTARSITLSGVNLFDSFLRRSLDIIAAFFGLIILSPLFLWIAFRMHHDSPGPVFYRGPRIGLRGKNFGILKFRTMYEKPESYQGALITGKGDPRITPYGTWLRDTKLNELPQLWNVLVGDMSLVGPRPEDPNIAKKWPEAVRAEILSVRPGITSPATILYRDEEAQLANQHSVLDDYLRDIMPSKLRLDTLYIKNRTFLSDLDIVFWTLVVLLPYIKHMPIPARRLYWGPVANFTSRYISWFVIDGIIAFTALGMTGIVWRSTGPLDVGVISSVLLAFSISIFFTLINSLFGLYAVEWSRAQASDVIGLGLSTAIATVLIIYPFKQIAPRYEFLPDNLLVSAALFSLAGFITVRYRERLLTGIATRWLNLRNGASAVGERILIVGAGQNSQVATWFLQQSKLARAFTVVGIVDDDPRKLGLKYEGHRVLGTTHQIPMLAKKYDIGIIFFTITNVSDEDRQRILWSCNQSETLVVVLPDMLKTLQDSFIIANTTIDDRFGKAQAPLDGKLLSELDDLAQADQWDTLKARLTELRSMNGTITSPDRYLSRDNE